MMSDGNDAHAGGRTPNATVCNSHDFHHHARSQQWAAPRRLRVRFPARGRDRRPGNDARGALFRETSGAYAIRRKNEIRVPY
jgi:hypothetical protein